MNKRPHKVCCTEQSACFLWQSQRSALWSRPGWSRNEEHNGDHAQQRRWWLSVCGSLQSDGLSSQQWLQDCRTLCSFSSICIALGGKLFLCSFPSVCVALGTVGGRLFLCSFLSVCVASGKGQRGGHSCVVYFPSLCIAMGGGGVRLFLCCLPLVCITWGRRGVGHGSFMCSFQYQFKMVSIMIICVQKISHVLHHVSVLISPKMPLK